MLHVKDLTFRIAGQPLFTTANAFISKGSKVGVVGRNGIGKSTLFKLIQNIFAPDAGEIILKNGITVGEISQEIPNGSDKVIENVLVADKNREALLEAEKNATTPDQIANIQERLIDIDSYSAEARASTILAGLGFTVEDQKRACKEFSGGWQMRISLAKVLFWSPDLLLLDEPTNFLDLEGSLWLENFLGNYKKTFLLISHDRTILTNSVNNIMHINHKKITLFSGNYDFFVRHYNEKLAYESSIQKKTEVKRQHIRAFVERFRAKASKAKQAQSRLKALEKMKASPQLINSAVSGFFVPSIEMLSPPIITLNSISIGYDKKIILKNLNLRVDTQDRIALIGKNGEGKSTFAKLLAGRLTPTSGTITKHKKLRIGYFSQHIIDELNLNQTPLNHLEKVLPKSSKTELISYLSEGGIFKEQIETKIGNLSGGQKARLALTLLVANALHLLILDEPTNHLDIESREKLAESLNKFNGSVILVSHDPHIVNLIATDLWLVKTGTITSFNGSLAEYENFLKIETRQKKKIEEIITKKEEKKPKTMHSRGKSYLRSHIKKAENQIEKLQALRNSLDLKLSDPRIYTGENKDLLVKLNFSYKELNSAIEKAESIWLKLCEEADSEID